MRVRGFRSSWKFCLVLSVAGAGLTSPARAFIPPTIAVKVVSPDLETEARTAALVEILTHYDHFQWGNSYVSRGRVLDCLSETEADECLRNLIRDPANTARVPSVLVTARPKGENEVELRCLGSGKKPPKPDKQVVTISLQEAFFGNAKTRRTLRDRALGCIWSAAAEDGTSIK